MIFLYIKAAVLKFIKTVSMHPLKIQACFQNYMILMSPIFIQKKN